MINTALLLSAVKSKYCLPSDYRLAKVLEMNKRTISQYKLNIHQIGDLTLSNIALLLSVDECVLYAAIQHNKAKTPAAAIVWRAIYDRLGGDDVEKTIIKQCFPDGLPEQLKVFQD
jgi:hypothetical protein